ncbi:HNH endonuclease signature motif containing protein [[Mycobacterium] vasticus]|uniref:HNH endonuclease signature motif containing protein n=1 Tax=[Mycobacterium] vasticus TaxID=2875777 RepID=A0ABU5YXF3_9MYCO|nr:HNH endonuclease signature motif containing protein [Mycolicibacter sp. MYC017]MEB3069792.1 HNH endonuclease signature motif containing protein [Mycolicibacter sp. MYC017]
MGRDALADRDTIWECLAAQEAINTRLAQCSFDGLSPEELVEVLARREVLAWQAPAIDHQIMARFVAEGHSEALAGCSLAKALGERLRISAKEARRRVDDAAVLGPRTAMSGEPLDPVLPNLAAAQAAGQVGPEHVAIARKAMDKIPARVAAADRERAEGDLAELATLFAPETFGRLAAHLIAVLDQDGEEPDERQRRAQRGLRLGPQRADGLSTLSGTISPELRATLEPVLAKLGAPGMCNAADEQPCVSGTPSQEQIDHDHRTRDQRHHDAVLAALRATLACGDLGQLNGLPVTVIVTATLAELQAAAGTAHTAGGSLLPMSDLLRMASHAHHYLSIFDGQGRALWLGRTKRLASADQRIVLHARDRGCTRPGCTVPGYLCQAHHLDNDWANNGQTDVDKLALACAPDNRMATEQGWTTQLGQSGRVEWIPPPTLDHGQPRINPFHLIEATLEYHRAPLDADEPDPQPPPPGWPDLDEPQPGEPGYDEAFEGLLRSYQAMDYDDIARHFTDDWEQTG